MSEVICEIVSEYKGSFPNVPFAAGVDVASFTSEPDPFFVTLPIAKVGAKSRNGLPAFRQVDVERIVSQVNEKKPEGNPGHTPKDKRGSEYNIPKLRWVGAVLDADGMAWGKAWIPDYAPEVRQFFRDAKRTGAKVGTSIYGTQGAAGLADMELETIDLGHPDRLGVLEVGAIPEITAQLNDENMEANIMAEQESILVAEFRNQLAEKSTLVSELQTKVATAEKLVSELQTKATLADAVIAELGADPVKVAKELITELVDLKKKELANTIDAVVSELVKVPALRGIAKKQATGAKSEDEARTLVTEYMATDEYQELATALVLKASGGRAIVTEFNREEKLTENLSAYDKARAEWGF